MKYLTYIAFEITRECPLAKIHPECPVSNPKRYQNSLSKEPINDSDILNFITYAKEKGFTGHISWHSYNEPMLALDRILDLMSKSQYDKFSLWTSGILIKPNTDNSWMNKFTEIVLTDYQLNGKWLIDRQFLSELKQQHPQIFIQTGALDARMGDHGEAVFNPMFTGCGRPFFEIIIDHYGNFINCCNDWTNEFKLGNIKIDKEQAIENWTKLRNQLCYWDGDTYKYVPPICKKCMKQTLYIPSCGYDKMLKYRTEVRGIY